MTISAPRLLLATLLLLAPGLIRAELKSGDAFPNLATAELVGSLPATAGKVVLIDFWASWCAPCKASFPFYAQLHADYAAKDLVIVAVGIDEKPAAYDAFVGKWRPPFAVVHDRAQKLVRFVEVPSMPTAYLLGRDGRVRHVHVGFHGATTERELRRQIDALLAAAN